MLSLREDAGMTRRDGIYHHLGGTTKGRAFSYEPILAREDGSANNAVQPISNGVAQIAIPSQDAHGNCPSQRRSTKVMMHKHLFTPDEDQVPKQLQNTIIAASCS